MNIVEKELDRKKLYTEILQYLSKELLQLRYKEVCHLLLRYIFNKNITKTKEDDPVFITSRSELAETQLRKDFEYSKINKDYKNVVFNIEKRLKSASESIKQSNKVDKKIELINSKIHYDKDVYEDISGLAYKFPKYINYALALNIRYTYMHLLNHGLARTFKDMGYNVEDATEGFASAFNHYFDSFCSAFPDLESPFGSKGSFFDNTEWDTFEVYVNPPFDESLMTCAMNRVYDYLTIGDHHRFIFTLPNWNNYPELEALKTSKWTKSFKIYKKGELPFIEYMKNKIIYPCDILEVVLENTVDKDNKELEELCVFLDKTVDIKRENKVTIVNERKCKRCEDGLYQILCSCSSVQRVGGKWHLEK